MLPGRPTAKDKEEGSPSRSAAPLSPGARPRTPNKGRSIGRQKEAGAQSISSHGSAHLAQATDLSRKGARMSDQRKHQSLDSLLGRLVPVLALSLFILACGPASTPTTPGGGATTPQGTKTLTMAHQSFPAMLTAYGRPTAIGTNDTERWFVFHANLTAFDIDGNVVPQVAEKVPTTQDGDWKVNPDGTMEVTWKIKPTAVWQDGTPLTARDYAFGYEVVTDRKLAVPELGEILNISSGCVASVD